MNPESSVREFLLRALAQFVRDAQRIRGVLRIAVIGSLTTGKPSPKDADVLITVDDDADITALADLGRKLKGRAQTRNRGADIFLADARGTYLGRTCSFKQCHPRSACRGRSCHRGTWIRDDLDVVRLSQAAIAEPALELWPSVVVRADVPPDTRAILLHEGSGR